MRERLLRELEPDPVGPDADRAVVVGIVSDVEVDARVRRNGDEFSSVGRVSQSGGSNRECGAQDHDPRPAAGGDGNGRCHHERGGRHQRGDPRDDAGADPFAIRMLRVPSAKRERHGRELERDRERRRQDLPVEVDQRAVKGDDVAGGESGAHSEVPRPDPCGEDGGGGPEGRLHDSRQEQMGRPRDAVEKCEEVGVSRRLPEHAVGMAMAGHYRDRRLVIRERVDDWVIEIGALPHGEDVDQAQGERCSEKGCDLAPREAVSVRRAWLGAPLGAPPLGVRPFRCSRPCVRGGHAARL